MEGVEDIPGAALHDGIRWQWESFPEYLDALESMPRSIDVAAQLPHGALRTYAIGEGGDVNGPATDEQVALIAGRSSARRALKRGRVSQAQVDFLKRGVPMIEGNWDWVDDLTPGKFPKEMRGQMTALLEAFREACENPAHVFGEEA